MVLWRNHQGIFPLEKIELIITSVESEELHKTVMQISRKVVEEHLAMSCLL